MEDPKKKLAASEKKALLVLICLAAGSLIFKSKEIFFGVLTGGGLSLMNIVILSKISESLFQQKRVRKGPMIIIYLIKMIILFGILFFLVKYEIIDIFAFIIGFSVILLIVGLETIFPSKKTN